MVSEWMRSHYGGPPPTHAVLICTGRGSHKPTPLMGVMVFTHSGLVEPAASHAVIRLTRDGQMATGDAKGWSRHVRSAEAGRSLYEAATWQFSCLNCALTPRIRKATIAQAVRLGMTELDVSLHDGG